MVCLNTENNWFQRVSVSCKNIDFKVFNDIILANNLGSLFNKFAICDILMVGKFAGLNRKNFQMLYSRDNKENFDFKN